MSEYDADVAVVGLGAIGSMTAWRLAERGRTVHGYERFGVGHDRGASSGQTRRFSVQSQREPRLTPLALAALDLWRALENATGRTLLHLVGGPSDAPALTGARQSALAVGLDHELLDSADLADRFPEHLIRPTDAGILDPMAGFIRPELSVVTATGRAQELGATVFDHARVLGVDADTSGVVVRTESGSRRYGHVVVAPGARARDLVPKARTTVLPRRLVQGWYVPHDVERYLPDAFPVFERVGDVNAYGFPTVDGATIKIGPLHLGPPDRLRHREPAADGRTEPGPPLPGHRGDVLSRPTPRSRQHHGQPRGLHDRRPPAGGARTRRPRGSCWPAGSPARASSSRRSSGTSWRTW